MAALGRSWASLGWKANLSTRPGKRLHNYGKSPFFFGKIHYKLQFSIAMLNYQRVSFFISFRLCFQMSSLSCIYPVDISTIVEDNSCLVGGLEHFLFFHIYIYIYWECHHPNGLSYVSEGLIYHQPVVYSCTIYQFQLVCLPFHWIMGDLSCSMRCQKGLPWVDAL